VNFSSNTTGPNTYKNCGEEFHQRSLLGHGNFAVVHSAVHKGTGEVCVLKTLNRQPKHTQKLQQQFDGYLERERWCLEHVSHPNLLSQASHAVRRSLGLGNSCTFTNARGSVTLVQEYANKGDLFYHVEKNRFPEIGAMSIFDQLLGALGPEVRKRVPAASLPSRQAGGEIGRFWTG
jgi:serine/threonine protein kinase